MIRTAIALALLTAAMPIAAQEKETVIPFASNGGIRNFEAGPPKSNLVYLQDRTLHWYKVTLTGPCLPDRTLDTISFKTDANGTFDRFSSIVSKRYPTRRCGVNSIVRSPPPPGQPGAPK